MALGGFAVEQRILQERANQINQAMIYEPDQNPYMYSNKNDKNKYYHFEDVVEIDESNY